jgi:hypothetical protein
MYYIKKYKEKNLPNTETFNKDKCRQVVTQLLWKLATATQALSQCLMPRNVCILSDGRVHNYPHPYNPILPVRNKHITVFPNPV